MWLLLVDPHIVPSNEAFMNLPEGTIESLLLPENVQALTDILTYHAVEANALSWDLSSGHSQQLTAKTWMC